MSRSLRVAFLTSIWVLAWGELSVANIVSGIAVSLLLMVLFPTGDVATRGHRWPRPLAVTRLAAHIAWQFVISNGQLSREVVTPGSRIRTGIVACHLRTDSERTITFVANVLSLSPGTMPVEVKSDPAVIYVHVLHLTNPDDTRRAVARLETLTVRAFGSKGAIEALELAS